MKRKYKSSELCGRIVGKWSAPHELVLYSSFPEQLHIVSYPRQAEKQHRRNGDPERRDAGEKEILTGYEVIPEEQEELPESHHAAQKYHRPCCDFLEKNYLGYHLAHRVPPYGAGRLFP
jgi:hypothetical protein